MTTPANLRPARVALPDSLSVECQLDPDDRWNGFARPYFRRDQLPALFAMLEGRMAARLDKDDVVRVTVPDDDNTEEFAPTVVDGVQMWAFEGWMWEITSPCVILILDERALDESDRDPNLPIVPIEVRVYDGLAFAVYDESPDDEYPDVEALLEAHEVDADCYRVADATGLPPCTTYTRSHTPDADYEPGGLLHGAEVGGDYDTARAAQLLGALTAFGDDEYSLVVLPDGRWGCVGLDVCGHLFAVEDAALQEMPLVIRELEGEWDFAVGNSDVGSVADDWIEHGHDSDDVRAWLGARCYDAAAAAALRDAGVTPEQAATQTDAGSGYYLDTIGYKVANGDLTARAAAALLRNDVTDEHLRALRAEAGEAGDEAQIELCDRALAGESSARRECVDVIEETRWRAS